MQLRIDPELGVEQSGPTHTAGAPIFARVVALRGELETEPELVASGAERERLRQRGNAHRLLRDEHRTDLVLTHEMHRALAQDAHRAESPAVQQHSHEQAVVVRG